MGTRRVVTGTNAEGRSYVVSDSDAPAPAASSLAPAQTGQSDRFAEIWMTGPGNPLGGEVDQSQYFPAPGGTCFRIGMLPDRTSPWHQTPTVDYELILDGEVRLELDEGAVTLKAGDAIVQGACNHRWVPVEGKPCRMLVVFVGVDAPSP